MLNYFTDEIFKKCSSDTFSLYMTERFTEYSFAYISNKNFGQDIPLDFMSSVNLISLIQDKKPDELKFMRTSSAYSLMKLSYNMNTSVRSALINYTDKYALKFLKIPNLSLENGGLMHGFLEKNPKYFENYISSQKKSFDSALNSFKKAGISVPLGVLRRFDKMGYDSSSISLSIGVVLRKFKPKNLTIEMVEWLKTVKEQKIYENNLKEELTIYHNDKLIESWESLIQKDSNLWEHYQNYTTLPENYNLDEALNNFIEEYSAKNLDVGKNLTKVLIKSLSEFDSDNLSVESNCEITDFIKKHFETASDIEKFMEDYSRMMIHKDYSSNHKAFFNDIRVLSNLVAYQGLFLDVSSESTDKREKFLEIAGVAVSDVIGKHKEIILSGEGNALMFLEAITQGSNIISKNVLTSSVWIESIRDYLNDNYPTFASVACELKSGDSLVSDGLNNINGTFDKLIAPFFKNIHEKLFTGHGLDKSEHLKLIKTNPGIIGGVSRNYKNIIKCELPNDDNLLNFIMAYPTGHSREVATAIDSFLSKMNNTSLKTDSKKRAIFCSLLNYKNVTPFTDDNNSLFDKEKIIFDSIKIKELNYLKEFPILLDKTSVYPLFISEYKFRGKLKDRLESLSKKDFSESLRTLVSVPSTSTMTTSTTASFIKKSDYGSDEFYRINNVDNFITMHGILNSASRSSGAKINFNFGDRDPEMVMDEVLNKYKNIEGLLNIESFLGKLQSGEYSFDKEAIIPIIINKSKVSKNFNASGVLRYLDINNNSAPDILSQINKVKDNHQLLAHVFCYLGDSLDKGRIGKNNYDYSYLNIVDFLPSLKITENEFKEVAIKLFKRNHFNDPLDTNAWQLPYRDRTYVYKLFQHIDKLCDYLQLNKEEILPLKSELNKSHLAFYANEPKEFCSVLFDNDFRTLVNENRPIIERFYQILLNLAEKDESFKPHCDSFEDIVRIVSFVHLDNMTSSKLISDLKGMKEVVELKKTIENNLSDMSDTQASDTTFKI